MKFFKKISLFIIIFLMTVLIILSNFINSFSSVIFSKDYIEKRFDEDNVGDLITNEILNNNEVISYVTKNSNKQNFLLKSMDKEWLDEQNPILMKGMYRYIIGDYDRLPIINIEPVKNNIVNIAIEDALKEYNVLLIPYIKDKIKSAVYSGLKMDKLSNTLDINILSEKLNSSGKNPFSILRNLLEFVHENLVLYLIIDIFLLVILMIIVKTNFFNSLRLIGLAFALSGSITVVASLVYTDDINYSGAFESFIREILNNFFCKMIVAGLTTMTIGVIIVFISSYIIKKSNKKFKIPLGNKSKILSVVVMLILLGFINIKIYNNTLKPLADLREAIKYSDFGSAIIESTGAEFLR